MRLITVQPEAVASKLKAGIPVTGAPDFSDPMGSKGFEKAYTWMVEQMHSRIGPLVVSTTYPMVEGRGAQSKVLCYPMWSWVPTPLMPDQQLLDGMPRGNNQTLFELEVPAIKVLCSDFDLWHYVLNNGELRLFEDELVNKETSWERIFALDPKSGFLTLKSHEPHWLGLDQPIYIQATTWWIRPEWIVSAKDFI
jgi:hypothetical protein